MGDNRMDNFISVQELCFFNNFFVRTKKQLWASSLCHSLVLHTYGEL